MFSLICVWINGWVNNREAGDFRRYRGHYDVSVMSTLSTLSIYLRRHKMTHTLFSVINFPRGRYETVHFVLSKPYLLMSLWCHGIYRFLREYPHKDVIKWKLFLHYWPFGRGIHRSPVHFPTKASDAELWCFPWSAPEQTLKQTLETPLIWDAIALIMTSL